MIKTQNITQVFLATILTFIISVAAISFMQPSVASAELKDKICAGSNFNLDGDGATCKGEAGAGNQTRINNLIRDAINIFSVIVGIIAVIMIIVGGLKFITSGGDSGKVGSAKQTVIYAIIGIIIVALAQIIVRFILNKV